MKTVNRVKTQKLSLKGIRKQLGLTQKEMAQALGVSERSIIRYESGQREPVFTVSQFKALKQQLHKIGLDIDDLPDDL